MPLRELAPRFRLARLARLPISLGIIPLSVLFDRLRIVNPVRLPISLGILPLRELPFRFRIAKSARSPNSFGMVPVNELLFRERLDTDPESQVTPNQKHSVPADPNQPVLFVQLAPSVELYNAIKALLSTELILLVD